MDDSNDQKAPPEGQKQVRVSDLPIKLADNFLSVYANNMGTAFSYYDRRLLFGQIMFGPREEPRIENRVSVTMPWEHVVPMRDLLTRLIKRYEREHGAIRTGPNAPKDADSEND